MTTNDKVEFYRGQKSLKVNRLRIEKGNSETLVYYWYQTNDHIFADLYKMKLSLFLQGLKQNDAKREGNAFVRISVPIREKLDHSHHQLQKFADEFFPHFERWLAEK